MTLDATQDLMNAVYTSSGDAAKVIRRLTRLSAFSADNVVCRLAVARSLAEPSVVGDGSWEPAPDGKQIRGSTLLGRRDVAFALLAMIVRRENRPLSFDELRDQVRFHWERGLRLLSAEIKEDDLDGLLLNYSSRALLGQDHGTTRAAQSPRTVLSAAFVGQRRAKEELAAMLEAASIDDRPRLSRPLNIVGPRGTGKTLITKAIALSLQLPLVELTGAQIASGALSEIERQLALQGYLVSRDQRSWATCPPVIFSVSLDADVPADELLPIISALHPRDQFRSLGATRFRVHGGGVVVETRSVLRSKQLRAMVLEPYSREDVADVVKKQVGALPREILRYLALAGRLNPASALERAHDFAELSRAAGGGRPSESLVLQVMEASWGMDRLGMTEDDYKLLDQVASTSDGVAADGASADYLERLGLVSLRNELLLLTPRGREARQAHNGGR